MVPPKSTAESNATAMCQMGAILQQVFIVKAATMEMYMYEIKSVQSDLSRAVGDYIHLNLIT